MNWVSSLFASSSTPQQRSSATKEPSQHIWLESSSHLKKLPTLNADYWMQMESFLQKYLVNQTLAIKSLTFILLRYHSKLYHHQASTSSHPPSTHPLFLTFIGSSGLGKIYTSKLVAHYCHRQFIYIDLSLIHNQIELLDSKLVEILKWHSTLQVPSNGLVICFDHLEHCNEEMMEYLLQVFENKTWKWKRSAVPLQKSNVRKKEVTNAEEEEEILLHCKHVIFVGIIEMKDQMVMELLQETISWKQGSLLQMNPTSAKIASPLLQTQQQSIKKQVPQEESLFVDKHTVVKQSSLVQDAQQSNLDMLDCITEFREKMTSKLLQANLFSITFLLRMNQMIPFFPFTNQTLLHEIVTTLNHLLQLYYHSTQIQIKYGEEVIIWLMKRWKPSMNTSNLIENHIITNLASIESELKAQDSVYLTIEPQSNKLVMRIHSHHNNKHATIISRL